MHRFDGFYVILVLFFMFFLWITHVIVFDRIPEYKQEINQLKYDLRKEKKYSAGLEGMVIGLSTLLESYRVSSELIVELTAYTARPEETNWDYTNTAIMQEPIPGWTVAVSQDLKYLLGKRVYIEGFGVRYVNDLMNVRYTKRVDILVGDLGKARKIGLQKDITMVLIEPVEAIKEIINNGGV